MSVCQREYLLVSHRLEEAFDKVNCSNVMNFLNTDTERVHKIETLKGNIRVDWTKKRPIVLKSEKSTPRMLYVTDYVQSL